MERPPTAGRVRVSARVAPLDSESTQDPRPIWGMRPAQDPSPDAPISAAQAPVHVHVPEVLPAAGLPEARTVDANVVGTLASLGDGEIAKTARRAYRRHLAWKWRVSGHNLDDIQAALAHYGLGLWSLETISADLRAEAARRVPRGSTDMTRALEIARYDEVVRAWWGRAVDEGDAYAAPILLRTLRDRAEMLGLFAHEQGTRADRPLQARDRAQLVEHARALLGIGGTGPST